MVHERSRRSGGGEWWTLPGGGLRPGETAEEALRREVFEETGLIVSDARYVLEMPYPAGMTSVFSVTVADGEPRLGRDDGFGPEQLGIDWLPVPELPIETSGVPVPPLMVVLPTLPGPGQPNQGQPDPGPVSSRRSDPEQKDSGQDGPGSIDARQPDPSGHPDPSKRPAPAIEPVGPLGDAGSEQPGPGFSAKTELGQVRPDQVPAQGGPGHRKHGQGLPKEGMSPDRKRPGSALPRQARSGQGRAGQLRPDHRMGWSHHQQPGPGRWGDV